MAAVTVLLTGGNLEPVPPGGRLGNRGVEREIKQGRRTEQGEQMHHKCKDKCDDYEVFHSENVD